MPLPVNDELQTDELVIGLEVHVQLATRTKLFCACRTSFNAPPNTHTCPVCLGLPGALPVLNQAAVIHAVRIGLALGSEIAMPQALAGDRHGAGSRNSKDRDATLDRGARLTTFDRKSYFYPDSPKGYQVSQLAEPVCAGGSLTIPTADGGSRTVAIERAHLEEDAGKSMHEGGLTRIDLNRAGTPLVEVVTAPDLRTPAEAAAFVTVLRRKLVFLGVTDGNLSRGSLRVDANCSLRPRGRRALGTKVEIKNLNSIAALEQALGWMHESLRLRVPKGEPRVPETWGWRADDACGPHKGEAFLMRTKEHAEDYRYFPEPDLPRLAIEPSLVGAVRVTLPEDPERREARYRQALGLSAYDARVLTATPEMADYFEALVAAGVTPAVAANLLNNTVRTTLNERRITLAEYPLAPAHLARLGRLADAGGIDKAGLKRAYEALLVDAGADLEALVAPFRTRPADAALARAVAEAIAAHPQAGADYRAGASKALNRLIGRVRHATRGAYAFQDVRDALIAALGALGAQPIPEPPQPPEESDS